MDVPVFEPKRVAMADWFSVPPTATSVCQSLSTLAGAKVTVIAYASPSATGPYSPSSFGSTSSPSFVATMDSTSYNESGVAETVKLSPAGIVPVTAAPLLSTVAVPPSLYDSAIIA